MHTENVNLIKQFNLIRYVPDMNAFHQRLDFGLSAESVSDIAFGDGTIENNGVIIPPIVDKNDQKSKDQNAINGDRYFYHPRSNELQFMDVKATNLVTDYSINMFRKDGWYLFNAFVESRGMQHFMIRNNTAFSEYARKYEIIVSRKNGETYKAYLINFKDLPSDPKAIGLELYPYMDSYKYRQLILKIREEYDKLGLPFADIIKSVP